MVQMNLFEVGVFDKFKKDIKEKGEAVCPCCKNKIRVWKKTIISTACAGLVRLVSFYINEKKPYHLDSFNVVAKDRNFSQLILWGLVEKVANNDPKKRTSGFYIPTKKGIDFVTNNLGLFKYVITLNNRVISFEGPKINVTEALGSRFDYSELISINQGT